MDRVRFETRRPRGRLASGSGRWRIAVAALASLLHAGGRAASGFEYRWFSDESTYLSELAGPVFTNDFGTTPPPGSIPNPLQAAGAAGLSYEVTAEGGLYRVFNGPYGITPLDLATPLVFQSVSNAAAFGGRFSLTDFDERRSAGTFALTMALGSGGTLVSATTVAIARPDQPTFVGLVAYGLPSAVSAVTLSTTSASLFVTSERITVGNPPLVIVIDVPTGTVSQAAAGYALLSGQTPVVKTGAGMLVLDQANTLSGSTTVRGGVLQLANGSALSASRLVVVAGGTGQVAPVMATSVASLDLASGDGLMDLTSGALTVSSGLTATELVAEILEGRGDGSWTGTTGITSSVAASDVASGVPRAVGWLDNGDGSVTAAFAAPGDTNIDWQLDVLDASNFLSFGKYDTGLPATWLEGDFNYDGVVDVLDASDFFGTGLYDTGNYNTPLGASGIAAVPEPSATALAALAVAGWAAIGQARRIRSCGRRDR
jgi:autotransporter-associated beta strand protein